MIDNWRIEVHTDGAWQPAKRVYTTLDGWVGCRLNGETRVDEWRESQIRSAA